MSQQAYMRHSRAGARGQDLHKNPLYDGTVAPKLSGADHDAAATSSRKLHAHAEAACLQAEKWEVSDDFQAICSEL